MIYVAADLARKRRDRGLKLNYPEAVALISEAMMEAARENAKMIDEEVKAAVARIWDEVRPPSRPYG